MKRDEKRATYYKNNLKKLLLFPVPEGKKLSESGTVEYVLSPAMYAFSVWVLQQAMKEGITRLYFLARDGYPFYVTAKKICEVYQIKIKCLYFYCSRYSLRVPMYSENIEEALKYICRSGIDVTFRKILLRSGLTGEQRESVLEMFPDIAPDQIIPYAQLEVMRSRLSHCERYIEQIKSVSCEKWEGLRSYCEQEGMLSEEKIGIVDSGWTGSTQQSIEHIRKRCGCQNKIHGYYFGLFELPHGCNPKTYHSYYFSPRRNVINKVFFSNCLFESVFRANHGTTCGYQIGKAVRPVLEEYRENMLTCKINVILKQYTDMVLTRWKQENLMSIDTIHFKKILGKSIRRFMWDPTPNEAELFGSNTFSDDLLDESMREIAPVFSDEYLRENHLCNKVFTALGIRKNYIHESAWYEASAIRNGKRSLWHRCSYSLYKLLNYLRKGL